MATKGYGAAFWDTLKYALDFLGLGEMIDNFIWKATGLDRDRYFNNVIKHIDEEMNKLRRTNSSRLNKASSILTDVMNLAPSGAFKDKINDIKTKARKTIDLANDIDNKINATETMAKYQAQKLANQSFVSTADLKPQVEKEVDATIQSLKKNLGEGGLNNVSTEERL